MMKRIVALRLWVYVFGLAGVFWLGWIIGTITAPHASADPYTCTGWSGRYVQFSNCGGQTCTGGSFGPFYTQTCNDPEPYYPPPAVPLP